MTNDNPPNAAPQTDGNRPPPPLFYQQPMPLMAATHRGFNIRPESNFAFAAKTNAVPITVPEFVLAARNYPIIFVTENLVPTVALGFKPDANLFVNDKGEWERGFYIPAYVRRYPFILLGRPTDEKLQLGVDEKSHFSGEGARPLFDGDKETETVRAGLNLCEQFHQAFLFSDEFGKALKEANLVEERTLEVTMPNAQPFNIGSFQAVNETKFRELPNEKVLEWWKRGWMHAVFFHLQSLNNWDALMGRASLQPPTATA